jgi:hypothetical protein
MLASPSFAIAQELALPVRPGGPRRLVHADCFRLETSAEFPRPRASDRLAPGSVLVAEWGIASAAALGSDRLSCGFVSPRRLARISGCAPAAGGACWPAGESDVPDRQKFGVPASPTWSTSRTSRAVSSLQRAGQSWR